MRAEQRMRRQEGDETYQLDAVVSLFAVMLVVLVALAASASREGLSRLHFEPHEKDETAFALRSIEVPYGYRQTWGLMADTLFAVDPKGVAQAATAARERGDDGFTMGAVAGTFVPTDGVGTYRYELVVSAAPERSAVISRVIDLDDETTLDVWAQEPGGIVVIVLGSGRAHLGKVVERLDETQRPHAVVFPTLNKITITRNAVNFAYEAVLRVF